MTTTILFLIACWGWFCLVNLEENPVTGFLVAFWLIPTVFVVSSVGRGCENIIWLLNEFLERCVELESGGEE